MLPLLLAATAIGANLNRGTEILHPKEVAKTLLGIGLVLAMFFLFIIFVVAERMTFHDMFLRVASEHGYSNSQAQLLCYKDINCLLTRPASSMPFTLDELARNIVPFTPFVVPFFVVGGIFGFAACIIAYLERRYPNRI